MKVVHIIEALGGGVYTYFQELSHFFGEQEIAKDISTTIIYSANRKEIDPERIKTEFSNGVELININMVREISVFKDLQSLLLLRTELKKLNPDIIHLHCSKSGVLGRMASVLCWGSKKIYYSPHGYAFLRTDISPVTQKIYYWIEKTSQFLMGGTTIACGDTEYALAKRMGPALLNRNGIDIEGIRQIDRPAKNTKLRIGTSGRISKQKNPILFNAIALRFPNYQFIWIGDGDQRDQLTASNIKICGWLFERKQLYQELNNLDIYLQTSLWEGLPISLLEAMALEKPVIATNVIGNKDIVVPKQTGFLFSDIAELDGYFEQLKEEKRREEFGKKAVERCRELFDKNQNFKNLLALYRK